MATVQEEVKRMRGIVEGKWPELPKEKLQEFLLIFARDRAFDRTGPLDREGEMRRRAQAEADARTACPDLFEVV